MKLSIITVNLNNAVGLRRTIDSVASQTVRDFEFIVIDGNSVDGGKELIHELQNEFTYSVSEKDSGIYEAMNKGIKKSSGEYLLFLNSGDWLADKTTVEKTLPLLNEYDVISGDIDIFDNDIWHSMTSEDQISTDLFQRLSLYHQSTFISRKLFETRGLYDEKFRSTGDYEFFIRCLLRHNSSYKHIPVTIAKFNADGMSNDPRFMEINLTERKMAWQNNFSDVVIKEMEEFYSTSRSKEFILAGKIRKILSFS